MDRQKWKKISMTTVTASILALGLAVPGQAATLQKNEYHFTWKGYTFHAPLKWKEVQTTQQQASTSPTKSKSESPIKQGESEQTPSQVQQIVDLVNAERQNAGLSPLKVNKDLTNLAKVKGEDMRDQNYFSHTSPTYGSPFDMMKKFGIPYTYAGENIVAGQKTAVDVMKSWMDSPGHRANILNANFTEIGVGFVQGGTYGTYWVQEFIKK